jgi:hypothetical protein
MAVELQTCLKPILAVQLSPVGFEILHPGVVHDGDYGRTRGHLFSYLQRGHNYPVTKLFIYPNFTFHALLKTSPPQSPQRSLNPQR